MCKSLCLLSPLMFMACLAEEQVTETKLLGELCSEKLKEKGIDTGWSFSGDLNGAFVALHQKIQSDDTSFATLEGNVYLKYFKRDTKFGFGLEVGNKVRSGVLKQGSAIVDTSYVFVETDKFGKVKVGYTNTAADSFTVSYANILTGYTGPDSGNLASFYRQSSGSIIATGLEADDGKALKVVWLSPVISGWSCGFSWTPSSRDGHLFKEKRNKIEKDYSDKQNFADQSSHTADAITGGIAYEYGAPEAFNAKVSVAGWFAKGCSDLVKIRNVKGYNIGAILGYKDYKLAFGYTCNGKSLLPAEFAKETNPRGFCHGADAGKIYNVALAYNYNKWDLSAGYFHAVKKFSNNDKVKSDIATVAAQYNFDRRWSIYAEYNNIRTKTCDRAMRTEEALDGYAYGNNHANMVIIGTKINF